MSLSAVNAVSWSALNLMGLSLKPAEPITWPAKGLFLTEYFGAGG